jgi:hypothetical protein
MAELTKIAEELRRIAAELDKYLPEAARPLSSQELAETVAEATIRPEAEDRPTIPAPPVTTTYTDVGKAFKSRYESARQMEWHLPRNTQDCIDIADWIDGQAERDKRPPQDVGAQLLNSFFSDKKIKAASYPIAWLAKDPGRWYRSPAEDGEPTDEDKRRRRQEAERRYREAKAEAEADHLKRVMERAKEGPQ